jgi:hypothetical protein
MSSSTSSMTWTTPRRIDTTAIVVAATTLESSAMVKTSSSGIEATSAPISAHQKFTTPSLHSRLILLDLPPREP